MTTKLVRSLAVASVLLGIGMAGTAHSAMIQCATDPVPGENYMRTSGVSACLDAGVGEPSLTGNLDNDPFLTGGGTAAGYSFVGKDDSGPNPYSVGTDNDEGGLSGTWSIASSFWDNFSSGAIGFKFGGGTKATPNTWFVYELIHGATTGNWEFSGNNALSHVNLYGGSAARVPEPATLGLLGVGLLGLGVAARRRLQG